MKSKALASIRPPSTAGGCGISDPSIAERYGLRSKPPADRSDHDFDDFLLRPGRGRRALRRAAILFLRLLTKPPLRPFSRLARCLASLRTEPPSRPSATACGFFRRFLITPPHLHTSSHQVKETWRHCSSYAKRFAWLSQYESPDGMTRPFSRGAAVIVC